MTTTQPIPVTVTDEAAAFIDQAGMRPEFEKMLEHTRQTVPGLHLIDVTYEHDRSGEMHSSVVIWCHRQHLDPEHDLTNWNWIRWQVENFPPDVCLRFDMISVQEDGHAWSRFLDVARQLLPGGTEGHWRSACGRAYYALLIEGRDALQRWGFSIPPRMNVHHFVRQRFSFPADPDLKAIAKVLSHTSQLRNRADYETALSGSFSSASATTWAIADVGQAIALLDQIDADPARRAAAVAAITAAFPP